ncbi:hypothetical protein [Modestobacter marinus]|uniref:hypothetical protein n=1 Tax=Modestobacter marinus TaxID=477641 RepID=UPI001C983C74|nr:hypothetical protein [Modestobacter marinus]
MSPEDAPTTVVNAVPRTPVVAVFGGDDREALEPARVIGRSVVRRGCVVLTGGRGPAVEPDRPSVRKTAIEGAKWAGETGSPGWWVEVERSRDGLDLLDLEHLPGTFPALEDPAEASEYVRIARPYADWLARRAPFDPARIRRPVRHLCPLH